MDSKNLFWEDIASKLEQSYILQTPPSSWKRSEVELFLTHFSKKVAKNRAQLNIAHEIEVSISYHTFRRIFKTKENQGSNYTRDVFAQYFGHISYLNYLKTFKIKDQKTSKNKLDDSICKTLKHTIKTAIKVEFTAYKNLPNIEHSIEELQKYFWVDHQAYKKIIQTLKNEQKRNWTIANEANPSVAELIDIKCEDLDNELVKIKTKEHWVIKWFDLNLNKYAYFYDIINTQIYYLKKDTSDNRWKVMINNYEEEQHKILPKTFDHIDFDTSITAESLKKKVVEFMTYGDTEGVLWWLSQYSSHHSLDIMQEVILLQGRMNNNIRLRNTNNISISKFYDFNKEIDQQVFSLLNKI